MKLDSQDLEWLASLSQRISLECRGPQRLVKSLNNRKANSAVFTNDERGFDENISVPVIR
jgi:hypothetical protein